MKEIKNKIKNYGELRFHHDDRCLNALPLLRPGRHFDDRRGYSQFLLMIAVLQAGTPDEQLGRTAAEFGCCRLISAP